MIVFVTAYDEYALEGFELNALDYLLKPVSIERLLKTTVKLIERKKRIDNLTETDSEDDFLFVRSDSQTIKVQLNEVLFFESLKDYVSIRLRDGSRVVSRESLKFISEVLHDKKFIRIHKSYIVNFNLIDKIEGNIVSLGKHDLSIGRSHKENLLALVNQKIIGNRNKKKD